MSKQKLYELKSQRADAVEAADKALNEGNQEEYKKQMEIVKKQKHIQKLYKNVLKEEKENAKYLVQVLMYD